MLVSDGETVQRGCRTKGEHLEAARRAARGKNHSRVQLVIVRAESKGCGEIVFVNDRIIAAAEIESAGVGEADVCIILGSQRENAGIYRVRKRVALCVEDICILARVEFSVAVSVDKPCYAEYRQLCFNVSSGVVEFILPYYAEIEYIGHRIACAYIILRLDEHQVLVVRAAVRLRLADGEVIIHVNAGATVAVGELCKRHIVTVDINLRVGREPVFAVGCDVGADSEGELVHIQSAFVFLCGRKHAVLTVNKAVHIFKRARVGILRGRVLIGNAGAVYLILKL